MDRTRVLIAEADPAYRRHLRTLLRGFQDADVVGEAGTTFDALSLVETLAPDVVLVDSALPTSGGLELVKTLRPAYPTTAIVVLAPNEDQEQLFYAVRYGAAAYLVKTTPDEELVYMLDRVRRGGYVIDDHVLANPALASRVLHEFRDLAGFDQQVKPLFAPLTAREIEVLEHAAQGYSNKEIARALSISDQTVKNYLTSIMRKLAVNDRTHAVVYAMQQGWIKVPEL
ncbi:MAG TPA: response regulator transcription factor [Chloroflexota bacterium]